MKRNTQVNNNAIQIFKQDLFQIKTDVPLELWDQPTIESERLKLDCEFFAERFEDHLGNPPPCLPLDLFVV